MIDHIELEARLAKLENQMQSLLAEIKSKPRENPDLSGQKGWLKAIQGAVKNKEAYREVVRLGRQISLERDQESEKSE